MNKMASPCRWLVVIALAFIGACTTTSGEQFPLENAKAIRPGTAQADVSRLLGQQVDRTSSYGDETWTYRYFHSNTSPGASMFVPFVGGYMPGAMHTNSTMNMIIVTFKNGVVERCTMMLSTSSTSGNVMGVGAGPSTSSTTDCADQTQ